MDGHRVEERQMSVTALWNGIRLICPACGRGAMYQGFRMNRLCPHCHVVYEREPGQFTGAVYINLMITQFTALMIFLWLEYRLHLPTWQEILICMAWVVVLPTLLHRHAKGFFIAFVHTYSGLTADDPSGEPDPNPLAP